jgi:anti-anti-sigma factor
MANLERSEVDGVTVLRFNGSLDQAELADVEKSFQDATHRDGAAVVLDLAEVDFLTTPAISMFLDAAKCLKDSGGRIVATGPQPRVGEVLRRLRLDTLLPVVGSVGEGVARVKGA